jgi:hypothetical protein
MEHLLKLKCAHSPLNLRILSCAKFTRNGLQCSNNCYLYLPYLLVFFSLFVKGIGFDSNCMLGECRLEPNPRTGKKLSLLYSFFALLSKQTS